MQIDDDLLAEAREVTKAKSDSELVRPGLEALLRKAAYEHARTLAGSEPGADRELGEPEEARRVS